MRGRTVWDSGKSSTRNPHPSESEELKSCSSPDQVRRDADDQIFRLLDRQSDVASCLKVNKTWCLYAFSVLWNRPSVTRASQVATIARVLNAKEPSLPYATAVKRINLSAVTNGPIDDHIFEPWKACVRAERLTLGKNTKVSARALRTVLKEMPKLIALDLAKVMLCDDSVIRTLAETCEDLQGLNINGCVMVGDEAMKLVADKCRSMRRVSSLIAYL